MVYPADSDARAVKNHVVVTTDPPRVDPWLGVVLACFILFAWASWGKLENPIIDIGHEVEIPARLLAGQILYRDVETYYGPLAYYANALALLLFGQRLEVFYAVGTVLALATTLLVYGLAKRLTNARWAALCTVCVQLYCALGPGLFNFMLPYSYGGVYATVFCLVAITTLDRYAGTGKTRWLVAAAIASGLAGLAKQEYGVAALGGVLVGANLCPHSLWTRLRRSVLVIVIASACVVLPLTLIAQQASWQELYSSLLPISQVGNLNRSILFQVSPAKTLYMWWLSFRIAVATSVVVLGSMLAAHRLTKLNWIAKTRRSKDLVEVLLSVAIALVGLTLLWSFSRSRPIDMLHPLGNLSWSIPVLVVCALMWSKLPRHRYAPLLWTLLVFALLLNARWLFYINFYGLYATPVLLLFFTLLYHLSGRTRLPVWRYLLVCLLIGGSVKLGQLAMYRHVVQSAHGTLYTKDVNLARAMNQTVDAINRARAESVLVLPEGSVLTFLTGTSSPSREISFLPSALPTAQAEQEFLARMQVNPPDLVVYVQRPFLEWGYETYAEFNPLVDHWITHQHQLVNVFPQGEDAIIRLYARDP